MRKPIVQDEDLIARYIEGEEVCLKILINRHKAKIYSTIYMLVKDRYVAEDIFQETFIKIIDILRGGKYKEEGKFRQWATRIARNLTIDHFRKAKQMPLVTDSEGNDLFAQMEIADTNREEELVEEQTHTRLRQLIRELPDEQREVLVLRHYGGLSFKEIAALTDVSINTALGRMRYALANIRKLIEEKNIAL